MPEHSVYSEVEAYMTKDREEWYRRMLKAALMACEDAKDSLGKNVISKIYSRGDKQNGEILKSKPSISAKIERIRNNGEECQPNQITDIIGITIVVQYSDQIPIVINELNKRLGDRNIIIKSNEPIQAEGYIATHLDVKSENPYFLDTWCEIQIKTMLHDALAHKMHDLNYKPHGELDRRLDLLMKTLATSLEAIEVQSQTIRDLILESRLFEDEWREASHDRMFKEFPQFIFSDEANLCKKYLEENKKSIEQWELNPYILYNAIDCALKVADSDIRAGWILLTFVGVVSRNPDARKYASAKIQQWIGYAIREDLKGIELDYSEIWLAPLALMAVSQTDEAISCSRDIVSHFSRMPSKERMITKFNLANFLVQREYFQRSEKVKSEKLKEEIISLINECHELEREDPSAFEDLRGMLLVSFAENANDVIEGITLIKNGKDNAEDVDDALATIFYELHSRLAWRRLLHLEDAERRLRHISRGGGK